MTTPSRFLEFDAIRKEFPGVRALDGVSFGVEEGRVHALIGENGAGKSTLLKILSGVYEATAGTIRIGGEARTFRSTSDAYSAGVAIIHQELQLVPEMTVAENLYLGHIPNRLGWIDGATLRGRAAETLNALGERIDPGMKVGRLPIAQRQMVEIAKALTRGAKIIAFDEPTSSLSSREIERLFAVIRDLRSKGCVILYVTHRMAELFQLCDGATVFRDGRHIETFDSLQGVTHDLLVNRMVGRDIENIFQYTPRETGEPALEVFGVEGPGLAEPVDLRVCRGEIVGLFGLVGAGRTELLRILYGAERKTSGRVQVDGKGVEIDRPRDAIRAGVMLCPEDRKKDGIIPIRSVMENINLSARRHHSPLGFIINGAWERPHAIARVQELGIRTPSIDQLIVNLSGGNQQKVILARWLSESVVALLLDEPTRGIDVGAKSEIYSFLYSLAGAGMAVLMASSDLPEVLGVADRIVVMREGRISGELSREEATEERVLRLALPVAEEAG